MNIPSYEWFIDRERNRPCLVAGTAPTITNFPYSTFKGVYITCGDGAIRLRNLFEAKYWVNANTIFPIPEQHLDIINRLKNTTFIFADSVAYCRQPIDPNFLRENLEVDWFAFDQRHFNQQPCQDKALLCCDLLDIYPERTTLQEFIQRRYNRTSHYSSGSTGALHALAFAILLGCSPIYLQGIEIPRYAKDYIHSKSNKTDALVGLKQKHIDKMKSTAHRLKGVVDRKDWINTGTRVIKRMFAWRSESVKSAFYDDIQQILLDFKYLIELAHDNDIEVYILSKTSTLNEIKFLKYCDQNQI